jgi:hypothetical protein
LADAWSLVRPGSMMVRNGIPGDTARDTDLSAHEVTSIVTRFLSWTWWRAAQGATGMDG